MNTKSKLAQDRLYRDSLKDMDRKGYSVNEWYGRIERGWLWIEDIQEALIETEEAEDALEYMTTLEIVSLGTEMYVPKGLAGGSDQIVLDVRMSLRAEQRGKHLQWYAYRKSAGTLRKLYVGHSDAITTQAIYLLALRFGGWYVKS